MLNGAYAPMEESIKVGITPGKLADLTSDAPAALELPAL